MTQDIRALAGLGMYRSTALGLVRITKRTALDGVILKKNGVTAQLSLLAADLRWEWARAWRAICRAGRYVKVSLQQMGRALKVSLQEALSMFVG